MAPKPSAERKNSGNHPHAWRYAILAIQIKQHPALLLKLRLGFLKSLQREFLKSLQRDPSKVATRSERVIGPLTVSDQNQRRLSGPPRLPTRLTDNAESRQLCVGIATTNVATHKRPV